jgi:hypothetical protein
MESRKVTEISKTSTRTQIVSLEFLRSCLAGIRSFCDCFWGTFVIALDATAAMHTSKNKTGQYTSTVSVPGT